MIKLAIVDDDARLAKGLRSELLDFAEVDSVLYFGSGLQFAKNLRDMSADKRPDVVLMDISMRLPNEGILATQQLKSEFENIAVVMFTISDEDDFIFEAFKAGAVGYLLKNESPAFIVKTILDVQQGGTQMSPSIARKTINFFFGAPKSAQPDQSVHTLSPREMELLQWVSEGMTYEKVAEKLFISLNTVKRHMSNIFEKLQVKNKVEALKKVNGI